MLPTCGGSKTNGRNITHLCLSGLLHASPTHNLIERQVEWPALFKFSLSLSFSLSALSCLPSSPLFRLFLYTVYILSWPLTVSDVWFQTFLKKNHLTLLFNRRSYLHSPQWGTDKSGGSLSVSLLPTPISPGHSNSWKWPEWPPESLRATPLHGPSVLLKVCRMFPEGWGLLGQRYTVNAWRMQGLGVLTPGAGENPRLTCDSSKT